MRNILFTTLVLISFTAASARIHSTDTTLYHEKKVFGHSHASFLFIPPGKGCVFVSFPR